MDGNEILLLGLGIQSPWQLVDQRLDVDKQPHEVHLQVGSEPGTTYTCPVCGAQCPAHDFQERVWRHLNFFQHHCYIHASVPRVKCPEHGVKLIEVPWARNGGAFTLLFEQAALTLVREMPVIVGARIIEITDKRLWRIVEHCVAKAEALTYRRCRPSGGTRRRAGGGRTTSRCLSTWNVVTSRCCS